MTPGAIVTVTYHRVTERPVKAGRPNTVRRPARLESIEGGMAIVRRWDLGLGQYSEPIRVGLNTITGEGVK